MVVVTPEGARASASLPPSGFVADDRGLVELVERGTVVGLDSPLGWPDDFVAAVTAHRMSARWPTFEHRSTDRIRESLRHRTTDLFVRALDLGSTPLSVSSDLIGVVAMRGAWLQSAWAQRWGGLESRDGSGRLVETYPAAALRAWGFLARRGVRYKGGGAQGARESQRDERRRIIEEIEMQSERVAPRHARAPRRGHRVGPRARRVGERSRGARGARRATYPVPVESREAAQREGWIHVPCEAFSSLGKHLPIE